MCKDGMQWFCRDGCAKIFQQPLDPKKAEKNRARGIDIASALTQQRGSEVEMFDCLCSSCAMLSHVRFQPGTNMWTGAYCA